VDRLKDWVRKVDENLEKEEEKRLKKEAILKKQQEQDSKMLMEQRERDIEERKVELSKKRKCI